MCEEKKSTPLGNLLRKHALCWLAWAPLAMMAVPLSARASEPKLEWHSFGAHYLWDMPDVCILDYRYGDTKQPGRYVPDYYIKEGACRGGGSISGTMPRGDYLYVKWRIKSTEEVYEKNVDLKSRLPANIIDHKIIYMINGAQLFVYLISPDRKDGCPNDYSTEAIKCVKAKQLEKGYVEGCPADKRAAMRVATAIDLVPITYCSLKSTILYPDQPTTQSK